MKEYRKSLTMDHDINSLRRELESIMDVGSINTNEVLELSRELDMLILGVYKQGEEVVE